MRGGKYKQKYLLFWKKQQFQSGQRGVYTRSWKFHLKISKISTVTVDSISESRPLHPNTFSPINQSQKFGLFPRLQSHSSVLKKFQNTEIGKKWNSDKKTQHLRSNLPFKNKLSQFSWVELCVASSLFPFEAIDHDEQLPGIPRHISQQFYNTLTTALRNANNCKEIWRLWGPFDAFVESVLSHRLSFNFNKNQCPIFSWDDHH